MQKSHKMKRICSLFRSIVYSIKEKLLTLRSEFHLRRKESLTFSRRQETSTFPDQKHYVKTRRPIAHTRYRGVGIGGIQQSSRWRCARPTVFLLFIQRCFAPLSTRWIRTEQSKSTEETRKKRETMINMSNQNQDSRPPPA